MTDWSYEAWAPVDPANWWEARHDHPSEQDCHVDLGCGRIKKGRIGVDMRPADGVNILMDLNTGRVFGKAPAPNKDAAMRVHNFGNLGWRYYTGSQSEQPQFYDYPCVHPPISLSGYWDHGNLEPKTVSFGLPFATSSIRSIISHHCLEHVGAGFMPLIDEVYRVLEPGGTFRAITPLFPSTSAVADADHCRYFMEDTWDAFCGTPGDDPTNCWLASFSVPYTRARFKLTDKDLTARCPPSEWWSKTDARELRVTLEAVK